MTTAYLLQTLASLVAILMLAGLAWWAKIAPPAEALDETTARRLLADEFPDHAIGSVILSADREAAIARAGDEALVVYRLGDGYVARATPWADLVAGEVGRGGIALRFNDITAPRARFALADGAAWPPAQP